ncbi:MAG: 2-amino-4-hydroxy-6-hydroxymethyldihydropteridine diphosphokinase [Rheinheimera sp.]|nr:2-amino-4-hydroxy-6-hydroxymethyldihydropteridine diphosphokinase [Rheinheimera sp.]
MGPQDQPDYVNAVAALHTKLSAEQLLDQLQQIELSHGRVRKAERWGPRTLDLDILLFGDMVIETPRLTVPHYGMAVREFVLYPLAEIAPDLQIPKLGSLAALLAQVPINGLSLLQSP